MYQGASKLAIDPKGRISMPTRHRELLSSACEGRVTLTRHPDGCLLLYPRPRWEIKRKELSLLPYSARALQRLLLGNAMDTELDAAGRLLIPNGLRDDAKLAKEASLVGLGEHFEIWDPILLREREASDLAEGLPKSAAEFTF
jgi:MraZ protein